MAEKKYLFWLTSILAFLLSAIYYFWHSKAGLYLSFGKGADWAHSLALIEVLAWKGKTSLILASLGEMSLYPPGSHLLVALLTRTARLNPLQGIQVISAFFMLLGMLAIAWHYVEDFKNNLWALFGATLGLALAVSQGFDLQGMLIYNNFFFPQLVGTSLALVMLFLLKNKMEFSTIYSLVWGILYVVVGTFLLIYIHPNPAIWFALAAALNVTLRQSKRSWLLISAIVFTLGIPIMICSNPYFLNVAAISANNGYFGTRYGELKTEVLYHWLIIAPVLLGAISFLILWLRPNKKIQLIDAAKYCGTIAAFLLIYFQMVAWHFGYGSPYAVKKWLPLLGIWLPYFVGFWLEQIIPFNWGTHLKYRNVILSLSVLLVFAICRPYAHNQENQARYIELRNKLLPWRGKFISPRRYPQFESDPMVNYYFAIGVLFYPRDREVADWLKQGTQGKPTIEF